MKKHVWRISNKNSAIHFKAKYLRISSISGYFSKFKGTVVTEDFFKNPSVSLVIDSMSIETFDEKLDSILRSEAFFPKGKGQGIEFISMGGCKQSSGKIWELTGELVIEELRKPLTLIVNFSDIKEHLKRPVALFYLFGKIGLKEMGLGVFHEKGIGDEILLNAEIFMYKMKILDE